MSRNTIQQDIIGNVVKSMRTHPSPDEVYEAVHEKYPSIGRATVYRVLNKLADKGELMKVNLPHTADRFDFRTDEHVHMHCTECNRVFDAELDTVNPVMNILKQIIEDDNSSPLQGFEITEADLSFEGVCSKCRQKGL